MTDASLLAGCVAEVRVPATSANLGPGFDSFGIAVARYGRRSGNRGGRPLPGGRHRGWPPTKCRETVTISCCGAAGRVFAELGEPAHALALQCVNRIPHGGGQGSSAAATVAGMLLAQQLTSSGSQLDGRTCFDLRPRWKATPTMWRRPSTAG